MNVYNNLKSVTCVRCRNVTERFNTQTKEFKESFICYGNQCFEIGQKMKKVKLELEKAKKEGRELPKDYKLSYKDKVLRGMKK